MKKITYRAHLFPKACTECDFPVSNHILCSQCSHYVKKLEFVRKTVTLERIAPCL